MIYELDVVELTYITYLVEAESERDARERFRRGEVGEAVQANGYSESVLVEVRKS